jgi:hypothetical protein
VTLLVRATLVTFHPCVTAVGDVPVAASETTVLPSCVYVSVAPVGVAPITKDPLNELESFVKLLIVTVSPLLV